MGLRACRGWRDCLIALRDSGLLRMVTQVFGVIHGAGVRGGGPTLTAAAFHLVDRLGRGSGGDASVLVGSALVAAATPFFW